MKQKPLIQEIEDYLAETGMGPSYFGVRAAGNPQLVNRLRKGRDVLTTTETRVRAYIAAQRKERKK